MKVNNISLQLVLARVAPNPTFFRKEENQNYPPPLLCFASRILATMAGSSGAGSRHRAAAAATHCLSKSSTHSASFQETEPPNATSFGVRNATSSSTCRNPPRENRRVAQSVSANARKENRTTDAVTSDRVA